MRLSEAIRLGAMLHPQAFGRMWVENPSAPGEPVGTCALGAAMVAGYAFTEVDARNLPCPVPDCRSTSCGQLITTIMHLNDGHEWTREQIADWVESLEPHAPEAVPVLDGQRVQIPQPRKVQP